MTRLWKTVTLATILTFGAIELAPRPAQAHGGNIAAGVIIGAVVGGIIAGSIVRHKYRRHHHRYY